MSEYIDDDEAEFIANEVARIAALHKSAPEIIWLQVDPEAEQFDGWDAQTWCSDQINGTDVKYLKAISAESQIAELKQQRDNYKDVAEAHSSAFQECIRLREELADAKKQRDELEAELLSAQCQAEHNGQELASLRQRIDDAPVVAWYADDEVFSDTHCVSIDNPVPLISKEDLQK